MEVLPFAHIFFAVALELATTIGGEVTGVTVLRLPNFMTLLLTAHHHP
jgi:hypothetical protein